MNRWYLLNYLITVRYTSLSGEKEIKFTGSDRLMSDNNRSKILNDLLQKVMEKQNYNIAEDKTAKMDVPKKYMVSRAYVVLVKD